MAPATQHVTQGCGYVPRQGSHGDQGAGAGAGEHAPTGAPRAPRASCARPCCWPSLRCQCRAALQVASPPPSRTVRARTNKFSLCVSLFPSFSLALFSPFSLYLSFCLPACVSLFLSCSLSLCLSVSFCLSLSVCMSACLCFSLSLSPPLSLSLSLSLSLCLSRSLLDGATLPLQPPPHRGALSPQQSREQSTHQSPSRTHARGPDPTRRTHRRCTSF